MKAVVTVIGKDRVGIIAGVASVLAQAGVNILDISQTTMREYFTMIMLVDLATATEPLREIQDRMAALGEAMGLSVRVQHEDLINAMHNV
jgi:ACT domain-containing protein